MRNFFENPLTQEEIAKPLDNLDVIFQGDLKDGFTERDLTKVFKKYSRSLNPDTNYRYREKATETLQSFGTIMEKLKSQTETEEYGVPIGEYEQPHKRERLSPKVGDFFKDVIEMVNPYKRDSIATNIPDSISTNSNLGIGLEHNNPFSSLTIREQMSIPHAIKILYTMARNQYKKDYPFFAGAKFVKDKLIPYENNHPHSSFISQNLEYRGYDSIHALFSLVSETAILKDKMDELESVYNLAAYLSYLTGADCEINDLPISKKLCGITEINGKILVSLDGLDESQIHELQSRGIQMDDYKRSLLGGRTMVIKPEEVTLTPEQKEIAKTHLKIISQQEIFSSLLRDNIKYAKKLYRLYGTEEFQQYIDGEINEDQIPEELHYFRGISKDDVVRFFSSDATSQIFKESLGRIKVEDARVFVEDIGLTIDNPEKRMDLIVSATEYCNAETLQYITEKFANGINISDYKDKYERNLLHLVIEDISRKVKDATFGSEETLISTKEKIQQDILKLEYLLHHVDPSLIDQKSQGKSPLEMLTHNIKNVEKKSKTGGVIISGNKILHQVKEVFDKAKGLKPESEILQSLVSDTLQLSADCNFQGAADKYTQIIETLERNATGKSDTAALEVLRLFQSSCQLKANQGREENPLRNNPPPPSTNTSTYSSLLGPEKGIKR